MKKTILYPIEYLYVSTCHFSKNMNSRGDFYDAAYMSISLLMGVNIVSIMMLLKYFIGFEFKMGRIIFFLIFFIPPLIVNYYIFIRKERCRKLYLEIRTTSKIAIIHLLFSILFIIITAFINIP